MKVLVLTTSYPPHGGTFVAAAVEHARARGVHVDVVSPSAFRHFGIAGGYGIVGNLRARPWLALLLPLFLWNFRRAALRVRDADVVHAHWLVAGVVAATLRKPYVVQVWGTDVELARRAPWIARLVLRRAAAVVAASRALADDVAVLGVRDVRIVPSGVDLPDRVPEPAAPPHVLFLGRLSPEKGIEEFLDATDGMHRVIVGAGPVDVPESVGAVASSAVGDFYARAAVVCVPSRREGYGMTAREAMAHGRAVVATAVGGLRDAIDDGVDGVLVPPRDVAELRKAVERLLADADLRSRLGAAAREKAARLWAPSAAGDHLVELWRELGYADC